MAYYIAVDIGGTQIRAACYLDGQLEPLKIERRATQREGVSPEENLCLAIRSVWPDLGDVIAIGVASPGPLEQSQGLIITTPNIPQWRWFPIVDFLVSEFKVPVALDNDANLAALGEWKFGAGRGHHHLVYLTVSTGIGGGIITEDRVLRGSRGLAGELGHITILPDGPVCGCGQRGHLEALASGTAISRIAYEAMLKGENTILPGGSPPTAKQIAQAAIAGDKLSTRVIAQAGTYLGIALADFLHIFNPSIIIIGGGVSRSGDAFFKPLHKALRERALSQEYLTGLSIVTAALGDDPGLLGALALVQTNLS